MSASMAFLTECNLCGGTHAFGGRKEVKAHVAEATPSRLLAQRNANGANPRHFCRPVEWVLGKRRIEESVFRTKFDNRFSNNGLELPLGHADCLCFLHFVYVMHISWLSLLGGLFFGLIPPRLLISGKCKYLDYNGVKGRIWSSGGASRNQRRWWKLPLVWIDPVRGYVTAILLNQSILVAPHATAADRVGVMFLTALLLLGVLWMQSEHRLIGKSSRRDQTVSPTAFVAGMIVGLLPPMVAVAAIVLGLSTAIVFTNFTAGYAAACLATVAVGVVFSRNFPQVGIYGFLVGFPMLVSWFRRTPLVMPVRA